jgi:signal transduction histidine kinase/ligand-binding sensor domain-containing protein
MGKILFYLILFTTFTSVQTLGQTEQFKFRHLNISNGLSNNQVTSMLKDRKGFVWIATSSGLNRFDGYDVRSFRHDPRQPNSLPDNSITNVFETPEGFVGMSTPLGLALLDPATETFSTTVDDFYAKYGLATGALTNIIKTDSNTFWFLQPGQVTCYDGKSGKAFRVQHTQGDSLSISSDAITHVTTDSNGNPWVIHSDGVVERLQMGTQGPSVTFRTHLLARHNKSKTYNYRMIADRDGNLWFIVLNDNQGVYHLDLSARRFLRYNTSSAEIRLNTNIIGGIVEDNNGLIWVGTDHGGVNLIDKKAKTVRYLYHRDEDATTLSENATKFLYKDDQGIIWVGTFKRGVSYYHESIFRFDVYKHYSLEPSSLPYADVNRFVEDDKGNLWIGTNGGGLIYFDRKTNSFRQFRHDPNDPTSLSGDVIVSLLIDSEKNLWVGTYYEGLNKFDGKRFTRYQFNSRDSTSLSGRSVWEIFEDSKNNLWIGTLEGGVNVFERGTRTFKRWKIGGPNAIRSPYIAAITEDRQGNIWLGTSVGIDVWSPATRSFTYYSYSSAPGSLSNNYIFDIREDSKGRVWIGTSEGLNLFDQTSKTFRTFWQTDGLPHNTILTIQEDNVGHLWLGTPRGLSEVSVDQPGDGDMSLRFKNYTEPDGLQGLQFNENAAYKTRKGELIFGGPFGFNIFTTERTNKLSFKPTVVFTDFQLFQRSVGIGEQVDGQIILEKSITDQRSITLPPDKNFFSIQFSALNYFHPEKTKYQYRLEGLDADWLPVDENTRKITFTALNPGEYTLRVKASTEDGDWTENAAAVSLTILPPFWKTKTAFIIYVGFLIAILYIARKLIQQREQMKFAIEQERQEAIRMHELDMMKIKFFTNVSHEFRTPLTLILTPLEKMIKLAQQHDTKAQYLLIQRNAKRLLNLVNQLLDFRKLEVQEIRFSPSEGDIMSFIREAVFSFSDLSEKKSIKLEYVSEIDSLETIFDQDKLEKILFNLLSNAFKFTQEHGKVSVHVTPEDTTGGKFLRIDVSDTGIGISQDKLDRIFDRFFQNELPQSIVNQGSGIGLSITKEFVKIHGGKISVTSVPGLAVLSQF